MKCNIDNSKAFDKKYFEKSEVKTIKVQPFDESSTPVAKNLANRKAEDQKARTMIMEKDAEYAVYVDHNGNIPSLCIAPVDLLRRIESKESGRHNLMAKVVFDGDSFRLIQHLRKIKVEVG